ncbi:thiopeptide-type bacteriocin biosynthesis protein [Algoriphagus sp. Y33]|uniref:thiopeptide-type bacteriocin biosynthesis protein n=1 Tax=Algoriphagus sp. Y33 TaxID=2772483 RepID=UPI001780906B|nr:thiopeptide-type bacteriocin biosynthesis protein [Algoriphagus sp. Y33]
MDFIYRMHLLELDPSNEQDILDHWDQLKLAISASSTTLYNKIKDKAYSSLDDRVKLKVYKYVLRGRYRATPFGYWAGVGLGRWGSKTDPLVKIDTTRIPTPYNTLKQIPDNLPHYKLVHGNELSGHHLFFWAYSVQGEGWALSYIERTKLTELLLALFKSKRLITFLDFKGLIESNNDEKILTIWNNLINSGLLVLSDFFQSSLNQHPSTSIGNTTTAVNLKLTHPPTLSATVHGKLDKLTDEMGKLFAPVENTYLTQFKKWFVQRFDDRSVTLSELGTVAVFIPEYTGNNSPKITTEKLAGSLWVPNTTLDLREMFTHQKISEVNHLSIAYRVGNKDNLLIENIACNRPFAYSGRFSQDEQLIEFLKASHLPSFTNKEIVYADLNVFESVKSSIISEHRTILPYSISAFEPGDQNFRIGAEELLIGIQYERVFLYSERLGKEIIPVLQHPLNPYYISHPVTRLLWEIAHQESFKFLPYYHPAFQNGKYVPRLMWGDTTLQAQRWRVMANEFTDHASLGKVLKAKCLPENIVAGEHDRELLLNLDDPRDLSILAAEIKRLGQCDVYECLWKNKSPFHTSSGSPMYPEFIYSWFNQEIEFKKPLPLNRILKQDYEWIYIRIFLPQVSVIPFLKTSLPSIMKEILDNYEIKKWYFMNYYVSSHEIRLRILPLVPNEGISIFGKIQQMILAEKMVTGILLTPYYPEYDKYSQSSMAISESIFCFESLFILDIPNSQNPSFLNADESYKVLLIANLLAGIFEVSQPEDQQDYFKSIIKSISRQRKREIRNKFQSNLPMGMADAVDEDYLQLFKKHTFYHKHPLKEFFLINHLHMFCNRAFPVDTIDREQEVIYLIHKKLQTLKNSHCPAAMVSDPR